MAAMTTLVQGSEVVNEFTNLTFVEILFAKGFTGLTGVKLIATILPTHNIIRFRLDETTDDTKGYPTAESMIVYPATNGATATVYSRSGAVLVIRMNTAIATYATAVAAAVAGTYESEATTETLVFLQNTSLAVSNYLAYTQRDAGVSVFDSAYISAFNKRMIFNASVKGLIIFASSGFNSSKTWVRQTIDSGTGNIYLAFANSATGGIGDFGAPVLIAQNTAVMPLKTYVFPTGMHTNLPTTRYSYSVPNYTVSSGYTSPYPYFIATSLDGLSQVAFTVDMSNLDTNYTGITEVAYDFGAHYLGMFKSLHSDIYGLGGGITTELIGGSILALPFPHIKGVRVISSGGFNSTDIKVKQRSATTGGLSVLVGDFPALDSLNNVFLSISENNPSNLPGLYGAEVDISTSGTYVLKTLSSGYLVITTNRLLYNPYYNGYDQLHFNVMDSAIFSPVTPAKVIAGDTEYRCFYLKNRHPTKAFNTVTIWLDKNCNELIGSTGNPQYIQIGAGTTGDTTSYITDASTAPSGITFGFSESESTGIVITSLTAQQVIPIWVKRVVNPSATVVKEDILSYLRIKVVY